MLGVLRESGSAPAPKIKLVLHAIVSHAHELLTGECGSSRRARTLYNHAVTKSQQFDQSTIENARILSTAADPRLLGKRECHELNAV